MKLLSILRDILLEKKGDKYQYNCAMLHFDLPQIKEIHKAIDKDDLYTEDGPRTFGLENEPHITLLFGLHPEVSLDEVEKVVSKCQFSKGTIHNASLFEQKGYDVLKFDVDPDSSKELGKVNEELKKLPHTSEFPNYHPHCTIAYLKKGKGAKYVDEFAGTSFDYTPRQVTYSLSEGGKKAIRIKTKDLLAEIIRRNYPIVQNYRDTQVHIWYEQFSKHSFINEFLYTVAPELTRRTFLKNGDDIDNIEFHQGRRLSIQPPGNPDADYMLINYKSLRNFESINKRIESFGWFPTAIGRQRYTDDLLKTLDLSKPERVEYQAKYDVSINVDQQFVYHVYPDLVFRKIELHGLIPKEVGKLTRHPNRVYFTLTDNRNELEDLALTLFDTLSQSRKDRLTDYFILRVDIQALNRDRGSKPPIAFFKDPNMPNMDAVWTFENIPPRFITVIDRMEINPR